MDGTYSLEDLIAELDECLINAQPVPFSKKSMVDVAKMIDIVDRMRMVFPDEIKSAKRVVDDRNAIIKNAKEEAEKIVRKAEKQRADILNASDMMKEARQRAAETISEAQSYSQALKSKANSFADTTLYTLEQLITGQLVDIRNLRSTIAGAANPQRQAAKPAQQPAQTQQAQQPQQTVPKK